VNPPLQRGEFVRLTWQGKTMRGMVGLASTNGRSVMVLGEFIIAGWVGAVALSACDDEPQLETAGRFETLNGHPVLVERGLAEEGPDADS